MDMISIVGFQDEFFIIIDNLNPMRNDAFHFSSVAVIVAVVPAAAADDTVSPSEFALFELPSLFFFFPFFHRRRMHNYLFLSCLNVALSTKIVFL